MDVCIKINQWEIDSADWKLNSKFLESYEFVKEVKIGSPPNAEATIFILRKKDLKEKLDRVLES